MVATYNFGSVYICRIHLYLYYIKVFNSRSSFICVLNQTKNPVGITNVDSGGQCGGIMTGRKQNIPTACYHVLSPRHLAFFHVLAFLSLFQDQGPPLPFSSYQLSI